MKDFTEGHYKKANGGLHTLAEAVYGRSFPTAGKSLQLSTAMALDQGHNGAQKTALAAILHTRESALTTPCNSPCDQTPPPKPTQLTLPVTEANQQCLQTWLLNYYRSSIFNTCEHQPLPLKDDVPMRLMVDSDAEPVLHHSPIPEPDCAVQTGHVAGCS